MKAEYIRWIDSGMSHRDGWEHSSTVASRENRRSLRRPVHSIGFVITEDKHSVVLGETFAPEHDSYLGAQYILKKNIVKRKVLEL